jgi:hypothetical protein
MKVEKGNAVDNVKTNVIVTVKENADVILKRKENANETVEENEKGREMRLPVHPLHETRSQVVDLTLLTDRMMLLEGNEPATRARKT